MSGTNETLEIIKIIIATIAAFAAISGAIIALINWRNATRWKRAELAASYMAPLHEDEELIFALRCIDWGTGPIPIPERHLPMFSDGTKIIEHDVALLVEAMQPQLTERVRNSPQGMLYRLALDALFTRFEWIGHRVVNGLIELEDVTDIQYWMTALASWRYGKPPELFLTFLQHMRYDQTLELIRRFAVVAQRRVAAGPPR